MTSWKEQLRKLEGLKYPLIVLIIGIVLMLLPSGKAAKETDTGQPNALEQALAVTKGVGRIRLFVSAEGVVAVCDGAEDPGVRLDILHAIRSYTGFGSDRITILKMSS